MKQLITQIKLRARLSSPAFGLLAAAAVLLSPALGRAQDQDGTWLKTADGNWSDSANWLNGLIANGAGHHVGSQNLGVGVTRTIIVDTPRTIGSFRMECNGAGRTYVLQGETVTLEGNNALVAVNGAFLVESVIAGSVGVWARPYGGSGTVILAATNIYTGDTEISRSAGGGPVAAGSVGAIPHGSGYGNVVFTDDGDTHGILDLLTNDITINGMSSAYPADPPSGGDGGQVTSTSSEAGTSTLTVGDNDASGTFDGTINDGTLGRQLALTKIGTGTQALNGNSTYSGTTTVQAGTLLINGTSGFGNIQVNGGVLGGTGTLYASVTTGAGGAVGAGASAGTLTLFYGLDLSAGGTNIWELVANSDSNPGTDYDQIVMYSGPLDLTDSTLIVSLGGSVNTADPFWNSSHTWTIISGAGVTGSTTNKYIQVVGGTPPGSFSTANDGSSVTLTFTPGPPPPPPPQPVKITSFVGAGTGSVTVNYTNTIPGTNYTLQYRTNLSTSPWLTAGSKTAAGTTDSQTDGSAGTTERYYRVYYFLTP